MNKDIVLPSRKFLVSRSQKYKSANVIAMTDPFLTFRIHEWDLLPMARALVEIYEVIQEEEADTREVEKVKG